jgi:hypothetical protein
MRKNKNSLRRPEGNFSKELNILFAKVLPVPSPLEKGWDEAKLVSIVELKLKPTTSCHFWRDFFYTQGWE